VGGEEAPGRVVSEKLGRVIQATRLSSRQRQILNQLSLPAREVGRCWGRIGKGMRLHAHGVAHRVNNQGRGEVRG
jgi:hypothetical protein